MIMHKMITKESSLKIRKIQPTDNIQVAKVIKEVMTSFDCVGEGYSISDPEVDNMYESYNNEKSVFFVIADQDKIYGCGGIAPLAGGDESVCELKKMYFFSEIRGQGFGRQMMDLCLAEAKRLGYKKCYLETVERMARANKLYARYGFKKLANQEGSTGHCGCDTFYVKELVKS